LADALDRVGIDLGGIVLELGRALKFADDILVVVKDHNVHARHCALSINGFERLGKTMACPLSCESMAQMTHFECGQSVQFGADVGHAARNHHSP
jgi:hypothetical protein